MVGPSGATNNDLVLFDGTTGELIKDAGIGLAGVVKVGDTAGGNTSGFFPNLIVKQVQDTAGVNFNITPLGSTANTLIGITGANLIGIVPGPSSLPPSGPAGGNLSGNYPNPLVTQIRDQTPLNYVLTPFTVGQFLKVTSSSTIGTAPVASSVNWFNVQNFGAVGNGITDDTNAINLAIGALNAAGSGVLYFPATANFYKTVGGLAPITVPSTVTGDGSGISEVQFNGGPGIEFSFTTAVYCKICDISLYQNTSGGSTYGVFYNGGSAPSYLSDLFTCERVECGGGWQVGARAIVVSSNGAARITFRDTNCYGVTWPSPTMAEAFFINAVDCTPVLIDCKATNVTTCVAVDGTGTGPNQQTEGTLIRGFFAPNCVNGVTHSAFTRNTRVYESFFNNSGAAIIGDGDQNDAQDNYLLWNASGATGITYTGSYCLIQGNRMFGSGSTATSGIVLGGGSGTAEFNKVSGNLIGNATNGVILGAQCLTCSVRDTTFTSVGTNTVDSGTNDSITDSLS